MTRIFDALKKAEEARGTTSPVAVPVPATAAWTSGRAADVPRTAMPLLGAVDLDEEVMRAMSSLRVNLEAELGARQSRTILFLAPQGGEGTSTVALQFAQLLARDAAARPLLVDCNARRPAFTAAEGQRCAVLDPRLVARSPEAAGVVASNLFVVPVSPEVRAAGLMTTSALRATLDANAAGFDWVILDAPPVLDSPDAAALGATADGVIMVLQAGRTKRPVMTRAADLLVKSGSRLVGTVLNRRVLEIPEFIYRRI